MHRELSQSIRTCELIPAGVPQLTADGAVIAPPPI